MSLFTSQHWTGQLPTPAEKRKDEIRARVYEHLIERELEAASRQYITEIIDLMTYVYDTVEALPNLKEGGKR